MIFLLWLYEFSNKSGALHSCTLIYNKCLTNFSHNQGNINATILQKYCRFKSHGITRKMQIGDWIENNRYKILDRKIPM